MTKIKKYVDGIAEELDDAKKYMETALEYKASGDAGRYAKYNKKGNNKWRYTKL